VVQERGPIQSAALQNTVFALEHIGLDAAAAPRRGRRVRVAAGQSWKTERTRPIGERHAHAGTVEIDGEWHRPLGAASGLTLETRAASRFSSQRVLPIFERYPLGGASSLRGYDEDAFWVDRYALTRFEWRWFLGSSAQRVFLFWDHAWADTRLADADGGTHLQRISADGIGGGLRLETPGGVIGLDYGLPPGRPPIEGKIHLRLVSTF
jgi:outer membrane protein assembly factor BamA